MTSYRPCLIDFTKNGFDLAIFFHKQELTFVPKTAERFDKHLIRAWAPTDVPQIKAFLRPVELQPTDLRILDIDDANP